MCRTTWPPEGMAQVWNFSLCGSNRTSVLGLTFDSLYQTTLPTEAMPYGSDSLPPGVGHSLMAPVFGS